MVEFFEEIKKELIVIAVAAAPLSELRGAIPLGIGMGFDPLYATFLSILGNILPVPFLLKLLNPIMNYFERIPPFAKAVEWAKNRTMKKSTEKIKKYSVLGLFVLVAIPLPSTGAWTGCLAATLFRLDFKRAFVAISSGVCVAGFIVYLLSVIGVSVL